MTTTRSHAAPTMPSAGIRSWYGVLAERPRSGEDERVPTPIPDPTTVALLPEATQRLVRSVDRLQDADWTAPSGLPDWTRAHVVAHLALNAEGLTGALTGLVAGRTVPMYATPERRGEDIAGLAAARHGEVRDRLLASVTALGDALAAVPGEAWGTRLERTPGSHRTFLAAEVPDMRLREVEVHHVDLATTYRTADWDEAFAARLVDAMVRRGGWSSGFVVQATDLGRSWTVAEGGPTVSGPVTDLGWWLTGRGDGAGLTSESGALPRTGAW